MLTRSILKISKENIKAVSRFNPNKPKIYITAASLVPRPAIEIGKAVISATKTETTPTFIKDKFKPNDWAIKYLAKK